MRQSLARSASPAALALGCALLVAFSVQASVPAFPNLYASRPPIEAGAVVPLQLSSSDNLLTLVLDPGGVTNNSGTLCSTGNGDDVCGFYIEFTLDGDLSVSAADYTSLISGPQSKHAPDSQTLKVAIVTTASPLQAGPTPIATLRVTSGPQGGILRAKFKTVDAGLDLMPGGPRTIAVPEPGFVSGLAAGVMGLGLLARRRAKRGGVR